MRSEAHVHALCRVQVHRATAFDFQTGQWIYTLEGDDEVINILTDEGRVTIHTYIYGTSAQRTSASLGADGLSFIGLTNDGTTPAAGDTALASELSADGLQRTQGVVTLPTGAGTLTTISNQFTFTGVSQAVQKTALFDAASGGNMAHEVLFSQRTLTTNDTITISYQITLA